MSNNLPHPKDLIEYAEDNGITLHDGMFMYQDGSNMCAVGLLAHMFSVELDDPAQMEWWDLADRLAVPVRLLRAIEQGFESNSVDTRYIDTVSGRGRLYGVEIRKLVE